MAFAIMLNLGWDPVEALEAIRTARPIAGRGYVDDALDWWSRRNGASNTERYRQRRRVASWKLANHLDVAAVIRRIRSQERGA
jgi:dual specificity phosphatase 3